MMWGLLLIAMFISVVGAVFYHGYKKNVLFKEYEYGDETARRITEAIAKGRRVSPFYRYDAILADDIECRGFEVTYNFRVDRFFDKDNVKYKPNELLIRKENDTE